MKKKVGVEDRKQHELDIQSRNELIELEQFCMNGKVDNMMEKIEEKKQEIVEEMIKYANSHTKPCKWDREGNPVAFSVNNNPLVISNYFFKPIVSIGSIEPEYNAEKMAMVFDYYCYLITEVNDKIGNYPSSLTSFCKLAGITLTNLRKLKDSSDLNMRIIVNKIYDQIGDTNITMSQLGMVNERSTIFKMKSQNEITEKEQPKVSVNIVATPDKEQIWERIDKYRTFANKKGK